MNAYVALADMLFEFRRAGRIATARSTISGAQCTRISNQESTKSSSAGRATAQRSSTWRYGKTSHTSFAYCRMGCWAICGPDACAAGNKPNSGYTGWSSTNWNCGATAVKRSSSAASALLTSTGRGPICRSRPTAITPRLACSGISTGTTAKALNQFVEAPQRSGLYYLHARDKEGRFFTFPWVVAPTQTYGTSGRAGLGHQLERVQ